ncbi:hypothetical protein [Leucobacter soli]|uniref:hypothetical protein n=1 Tax=Leucobacter soli TaxID=2812850 RepID=UPI003621595A
MGRDGGDERRRARIALQRGHLGRGVPRAERCPHRCLRRGRDGDRGRRRIDPLTSTLAGINPAAEILLLGVLEPDCRIHSTNESVHPEEIRRIALGEALFLGRLGERSR